MKASALRKFVRAARRNSPFLLCFNLAVAAVLVGLGATVVLKARAQDHQAAAGMSLSMQTTANPHSYFRSGRWLADARTVAAAVSYLFEPEPPRRPTRQIAVNGGEANSLVQATVQPNEPANPGFNGVEKTTTISTNRPARI